MAATDKTEVTETLKIGDYVTFKQLRFEGFLGAEGILEEEIGITFAENGILDDALFAIHLKRQYSAFREYEDFISKNASKSDKYLGALRSGKLNEKKLNDHYMKTRLKESVKFGDTIQLFHVKSGKYLRVYPDKLAKDERQNLLVQLNAAGDIYSYITIMPRFKVDHLGDPVNSGTEVYLSIAERANEFIHSSERDPIPGRMREVNCSLEATSWKISIFQNVSDGVDSQINKYVLTYQIVYINDPEQRCNLSIPNKALESLENNEEEESESRPPTSSRVSSPKAIDLGIGQGEDSTPISPEQLNEVMLEPMIETTVFSRMLWLFENEAPGKGGPIRWKDHMARLRHVNTNLYLRCVSYVAFDELGQPEEKMRLTTTANPEDSGTLFTINEINSSKKLLALDKPILMVNNKMFCERGAVVDGANFQLKFTDDRGKAINFKIFKYVDDTPVSEEANVEPCEVFSGLSLRHCLSKYFNMTVIPHTAYVSTLWPTADRHDVEFFNQTLERAVFFSQGFPISSTDIRLDVDKASDKLRVRRQHLLCDQGVLEVLLRLIHRLTFVSNSVDSSPKLLKNNSKMTEEQQILLAMGKNILNRCFNLLLWSIRGNPENQMYVADHMTVLLAHLAGQPLAGTCVTEMLASNMELQETKIGNKEIAMFVEKLRSSKMSAMYLQLLKACCSCQGNGVDGNQCKVTEMLYSNTADIIIQMHPDYARLTPVEWNYGLYITPTPVPGSPLAGDRLVAKGIPNLSLSWTTNSIDFSPLGLFGKLSVGVNELYAPIAPMLTNKKSSKSSAAQDKKKAASMAQKAAVASYFVAQMLLGAEMCMDRNYVAFHTLDEYFPYEVLVTILKMEVTEDIKAASLRLLLCLHVDRDPQAETPIPFYTRSWSEVIKGQESEPRLPYVEPMRRHQYGLVQQYISDHIRGMAGRKWTELSRSVLQLLRKLIQFNFYGTNERMKDVIEPLVQALDRRNVIELPPLQGSLQGLMNSASNLDATNNSMSRIEPLEIEGENNGEIAGGGGGDVENKYVWQEKLLEVMEGVKVMTFIGLLVLAAIATLIYETIAGVSDGPGTWLFVFTIVIDVIFTLEITLRCYAFCYVKGTFLQFFSSFLNCIDVLVIAIDVVFMSIHIHSSNGGFVKVLRLVRLVRLLRILRAARVINAVASTITKKKSKSSLWEIPTRYSKCPIHEVETMIESVEILKLSQTIIEDRNLTLLLNYFYKWESGEDTRSPSELFAAAIEDSKQLSLGGDESEEDDSGDDSGTDQHLKTGFDHIMVDVLMFVSPELVQATLELLMAFHSSKRALLNNAAQVQLLVCSKRERQFKMVDQMLQQLERNAETHELWGELASEADESISKQTKDIMKELADICRLKCESLTFDTDYRPDPQIQDLFRNLGCFGICMKVLNLLDSVEPEDDGTYSDVALNTRSLCLYCNRLLVWFFKDCPANQELGYSELDIFVDSLDAEIESHDVIEAIFSGNERLIRMVPHTYINQMVEKIRSVEKDERSPYDLELLLAIGSVNNTKGIKENQIEIMKQLTSPGNIERVVSYFVPISDPEYAEKVELMAPYLEKNYEMEFDKMPKQIQYHIRLLDTFSSLTVGKSNGITAIEAKLQSLYEPAPLIDAMLDPQALLLVKTKLSMYFYNGIIDVELKIPGFEYTQSIWKLLLAIDTFLARADEDFVVMRTLGLGHKKLSRVRLEYHIVNIMIVGGFFTTYFDGEFSLDDLAAAADTVTLTTAEVYQLITSLYTHIQRIFKTIESSNFISKAMKEMIVDCLDKLKKAYHTNNPFTATSLDTTESAVILDLDRATATMVVTIEDFVPPPAEDDDEAGRRKENAIISKYNEFISALSEDEALQRDADLENTKFISVLSKLPFIADPVTSDIRQETLFKKLVTNISENITYVNNERRLSPRLTKTAIWIIRAFRTMIENKMEMTIYERDDDGGLEEDLKVAPVISALNACGATVLLLDLISVGIDPELQLEAIKLGVGMLFKEGGAIEVQRIFYNHLMTTESHYFFRQVHHILISLIAWHKQRDFVLVEEGNEVRLPDNFLIVRFVQLMCEGHYLPNQEIMAIQPKNIVTVNLLDDLAEYLEVLSRLHCRTSTTAAIRVASTVLEVIQGPCRTNQSHFVMKTDLVETMNRLLRAIVNLDCIADDELEIKKIVIDIFQGLLEGQPLTSVVYERILSVIHLDIILQLSGQSDADTEEESFETNNNNNIANNEEQLDSLNNNNSNNKTKSEAEEILQTECIVLLQMLCDCKPSLREELGLPTNPEDINDKDTACVEVVWNNELNRRFFHIPDICEYMSKSSMDTLVEYVDRSTLENKLTDFLERSQELYREIKHHQLLLEYKLTRIFSKKNFDRSTTFSFFLSLVINGIFLATYTAKEGTEPHVDESVTNAVNALNYLQIATSCYNLIVLGVVISPVRYQTLCALGSTHWNALLWTILDPLTIYYFVYMVLSILGVVLADYFLSFLLLDIVMKNSSTRNVLMSVYQPRSQLMYLSILVIFMVYIYSFYLFTFFRMEVSPTGDDNFPINAFSLWDCFKVTLAYGLRQAGGAGDMFSSNLGERWVLDVTFFLVILIVVLNLVYGIIIMTFSVLREEKAMRLENTKNICFVCGIDRAEFDRASAKGDGFKLHIKFDHNMWNYVRFMIFLWEQDRDDDDGLEQYVRRAIVANDLNWFPMNKAIRLEAARGNEENLVKTLKTRIETVDDHLNVKLQLVQSEVNIVLEQVSQALKQEHIGSNEADELKFNPSQISLLREGKDGKDGRQQGFVDDDSGEFGNQELYNNNNNNNILSPSAMRAEKPVYVQIETLSLSSDVNSSRNWDYFVALSVDGVIQIVPSNRSDGNIIVFNSERFCVSRYASIDNTQICRMRVYRRAIATATATAASKQINEDDVLLGYADFTFSELVFADGSCIDKYFINALQPSYDCLTVFTTSVGIMSFNNNEESLLH